MSKQLTPNLGLVKSDYAEKADVEDLNQNFDKLDEAAGDTEHSISDLQAWVPATPGSNDQVLMSNGDGTTRWDNAATSEEIGEAVTNWLEENVPSGTTVVVDKSLSVENAAAESETTGQKISDLKSALMVLEDATTLSNAGTLNGTSSVINAASYGRCVYASVDGIKRVSIVKNIGATFRIAFTVSVPAVNVAISGYYSNSAVTEIQSDVPDGCKYLVVYYFNSNTDTGTAEDMLASVAMIGITGANDVGARHGVAENAENIASLGHSVFEQASAMSDIASKKAGCNLWNGKLYSGYIDTAGLWHSGSQRYTDKIDVHDKIGETLRVYNDGEQSQFRFVCVYDQDNNALPSIGSTTLTPTFVIPTGAYYVVLSFGSTYVNTPYILITTAADQTVYMPPVNKWAVNGYASVAGYIDLPKPGMLTAETLETGKRLTGGMANSVKRLGTYVMYCKVGDMSDDAYIIVGKNTSKGYAVGVSASKWAWFVNDVNQGGGTHGLTIKDYLYIVVDKVPGTGAVLTIYTNGGSYTRTNTSWKDDNGTPYVYNASGDTIKDVRMGWTSSALRHRNWVFGDSYVSMAPTRWPKYVYDLGFGDNLMINGYPGENSKNGYHDFIACLAMGTPTAAAWCLGMNDADNGEINANWLKYTQAFLSVCALYDITPILATIPCCPIADHQYKNAWVRASGYRYIDFASAVNVDQDDPTWFDGMLSDDNVHPTEQGAIALSSKVLTDFQEVLDK